MDKNAIKKYAIWARRELIERVSQKAMQYGITGDGENDPSLDSVNGKLLSDVEKKQRQALIKKVRQQGYEQAMEEAAYTWFNRFAALRFMEVNGYLPSHVRVFTDDDGNFKPQILSEAIHLELDGLNMDKVYELKNANKNEELFKYLLITQCNALSAILPGMFQKIADYTELLLPDNLLREGSVIERMVSKDEGIPESDWTDQVQIIGWLYQYYNTEPKDKVFADLKKNIKITKEKIPAATQLFTPDWIVHYMVENSLGRLWLEGHPNDALKSEWKYYLDEAEQEPDVQAQLGEIRKEYAALKPEEIRCIDPCMGSGHILCVLFDTLVQIYEDYGYTAREAAGSIVEKNLWGLDIDERAAQLAYFAVMMKARQYDRRFFSREIQPHVHAIVESNGITSASIQSMGNNLIQAEYDDAVKQVMRFIDEMHDAKAYGSIVNVTPCDWDLLRCFAVQEKENAQLNFDIYGYIEPTFKLQELINVGEVLAQRYHTVVTNPPYMGNSGFPVFLTDYTKINYPNSKNDLYSIMIEKCCRMASVNGYVAMITMQSWVNAPTFKKLRYALFDNYCFRSINNMGSRAFDEIQGEKVKNVAFVIMRNRLPNWIPTFVDLTGVSGENEKRNLYLQHKNLYKFSRQSDFLKHKDCLVVYKTKHVQDIYSPTVKISDVSEVRRCIATGNDDEFIRMWYEVEIKKVSSIKNYDKAAKWYFIADGGERRRWYGNIRSILNWEKDGAALRSFNDRTGRATLRNVQYLFKDGLTYTYTSMGSGIFNARILTSGMGSIGVGPVIVDNQDSIQMLGFINSVVFRWFWDIMYGKVSTFETGNVGRIAYKTGDVSILYPNVKSCIEIAKSDWNDFEISHLFLRHPLVYSDITIEAAFKKWEKICYDRIQKTKESEEAINSHFIEVYQLQDEIVSDIKDSEITLRKADLGRDIRSLISYAVGCMFGRYSLHKEGLIFAGGKMEDVYQYRSGKMDSGWPLDGTVSMDGKAGYYLEGDTYLVDPDNIIPICDDDYFDDDITGRFIEWVELVYGTETLEENLQFIADALGGRGTSREVIRAYFINGFYADHCKVYQKRPIYWLFDSGKKNGFKCLIYMHRYQPDTIARIRTDYVHEQQSRYRTAMEDLEQRMNDASTSERVKLKKRLTKMQAQAEEIREYEEKIHHLADQMIGIDLDDGVKHNYKIFQDVLAKIK